MTRRDYKETTDRIVAQFGENRPKTGIDRRCPLWPETVEALQDVLAKRKEPKDSAHAGLVFITFVGGSFAKESGDNPIAKEFAKLVNAKGLVQQGRGFYSLRHTFRTVADYVHGWLYSKLKSGESQKTTVRAGQGRPAK
jgi:integrase